MIEFKILDRATGLVVMMGKADSLREVEKMDGYSSETQLIIYKDGSYDEDAPAAYGISPPHH